ncbi:MAG: hypothetical protein GC155_07110 [Alphaproteobacteria bacterium]|nr:hypothetical protein [Alphaproteobacteria bacterium]
MNRYAVAMVCLLALAGCQKVGTALDCGGETFHVAFGKGKANVTSPDKSHAELKLLEQPAAAGAAEVYTNGAMTFTRLANPGQPAVVRFSRGKMAFQECTTAAE